MKNIIKLLSLVLICTFALSINNVDAQSRKKKKKNDKVDEYFDDKGDLMDRLWYGADLSFNFIPLPGIGNIIGYGISPMAGLKLNNWFSVGPRIQFSVLNGRISEENRIGDNEFKFNAVTVGAGLFARAKIGRAYFAHVEFDRVSYSYPAFNDFFNDDGTIKLQRQGQSHFYVGGGYQGLITDNFGYSITALFDTLVDRDTWGQQLPIDTRIGITYKF